MKRGVYFIANDHILEMAIAFLNSFRKYNPATEICLIPYDDKFGELTKLRGLYRFKIFDDRSILCHCDEISKKIDGRVLGQYRKLAVWKGDFDEFLYIDADTVVLRNLDFAYAFLRDTDYLASHSNIASIRRFVWKDTIAGCGLLNEQQIAFAANTGFFASRKTEHIWTALKSEWDRMMTLVPHMELSCTEQPLLNFLIVSCGWRYSSLTLQRQLTGTRSIPRELWGGKRLWYFRGKVFLWKRTAFLVHWAGKWQATYPHEPAEPRVGQRRWLDRSRGRKIRNYGLWKYFRNLSINHEVNHGSDAQELVGSDSMNQIT